MPRLLIQNATILPFTPQSDGSVDLTPVAADIFIEGEQITDVIPRSAASATQNIYQNVDQVIDARNHLLIPGFVDAHTHTVVGILEKCAYETLPLELWMLCLPPDQKLEPRMHYLCAAMAGMEAIKNGTTTLQDDLYALPYTTPEIFEATAQAYIDLGIRASLSLHAINKPLYKTIPYIENWLSSEIKQNCDQFIQDFSIPNWAALFRDLYTHWHGKQGLITTILAPSAAQRVTPALMQCIANLSEEYNVPIHTHLLETRTQAVTGLEFYGESVIQFAHRHGLLTHRTTIAHGVWLTPDDIQLVAEAGATIVHNPVSNYRLCSGIASIQDLIAAGVNLAVGTDGIDSFNLFHVLRTAGLSQSVVDANYQRYPKAADVLKWATYGGARASLLHNQIGAIAAGMKADFVLYDLHSLSFTPCHNFPIHLVYGEDGRSVRKVFVNGQMIVDRGQILTINESDLIAEFRERFAQYLHMRPVFRQQGEQLRPAMQQMLEQTLNYPLPIHNFSRIGNYSR
jgi:5-methylthioadenosine/S-adenosylhomocysteine deaminase